MEYLYYAGDERFGALGVSTSATAYIPRSGGPLPRLSQVQHLSEVIAKIEAAEPITEVEAGIVRAGGSLGGAKPKALIEVNGEQWVVKFFNGEPIDTPLIEHATMTLAQRAGITVAQTQVIRLTGANAIAIRRFDRERDLRIHSISAGTAIRAATASGTEPDMGYPELARVIRRIGTEDGINERDARELFRRMTFNILIDNTDDHEKNHSLLVVNPLENGRLRLSPAYDVVPTNSGQGHQEFICGNQGRDSTLENAMSQCEAFGLSPAQGAAEVAAVIDVVNGWKERFSAAPKESGPTPRATNAKKNPIPKLSQRIEGWDLQPPAQPPETGHVAPHGGEGRGAAQQRPVGESHMHARKRVLTRQTRAQRFFPALHVHPLEAVRAGPRAIERDLARAHWAAAVVEHLHPLRRAHRRCIQGRCIHTRRAASTA
jgi:hypothetical protein